MKQSRLASQFIPLISAADTKEPVSNDAFSKVLAIARNEDLDIVSKDPKFINLPMILSSAAETGLALRGIMYVVNMLSKQYAHNPELGPHVLALMAGETGGTFNPKAFYNGQTRINERLIPTTAYGLLQQTRANWESGIEVASESDIIPYALNTRFLSTVAQMAKTRLSDLIAPITKYGPAYSEVYQIIPASGQILALIDRIDRDWRFNPGTGWHCIIPESKMLNPAVLDSFKVKAGKYLTDKSLGYQQLLTVYHINGGGIFTRGKALAHPYRLKDDVQYFQVLRFAPEVYSLSGDSHIDSFKALPASTKGMVDTVITDTHKGHFARGNTKTGGTDLRASYIPVYAPWAGTVQSVVNSPSGGKNITMKLDSGETLFVCHLSKQLVKPKDRIAQGQQIAISGATGTRTPHLHVRVSDSSGKIIDAEDASFGLQWLLNSSYGLTGNEVRTKMTSYKPGLKHTS